MDTIMRGELCQKIMILTALFFCLEIFAAPNAPIKPQNVPKSATWDNGAKVWSREEKRNGVFICEQWDLNGFPVVKKIQKGKLIRRINYADAFVESTEQVIIEIEAGDGPDYEVQTEKKFGKVIFYSKTGKIAGNMCYAVLPLKNKDKDINYRTNGTESYPCGEGWASKPNSNEIIRESHPDKCLQGCGEFKPFMPPGKYKVHATNVVFRDKPSTKGKSLGTLAKGTEVQVIEDTHKIETHDFETAPWVKVKHDGKTGYVFGGFLDSLERNDL
jgi:hypothetical protein